jgi:hypothetical protein
VLRRYGSILAITKDPDAVRGAIASAQKLDERQLTEARDWFKRFPRHPLVLRIKQEKRAPTVAEFRELETYMRQHRDEKETARQKAAKPGQHDWRKAQKVEEAPT